MRQQLKIFRLYLLDARICAGASMRRFARRLLLQGTFSFLLAAASFYSSFVYAADPAKGSEVYRAQCESCHGARGEGLMPGTLDIVRGNILLQADGSLLEMIKAGRNAMPSYNGLLSDEAILDVIAYMRTW